MTIALPSSRAGVFLAVLATALVLVTAARADPEEEQALISQAHEQLAVVLDTDASKEHRIAALRRLKAVHEKIKQFAATDPTYSRRADTDELRLLNEDMGGFLAAEAAKLSIDLNVDAPTDEPTPAAGNPCKGVPLPDYSGHHERLRRAATDVTEAYRELETILDEPVGEPLDTVLDQRNRRDRALEKFVQRQVRLAWEAADETSATKLARIALLTARERFLKHLLVKRDADAEETKVMRRLAEVHAEFNKSKWEWAQGGKTPPNLLQLEAEAVRLIKRIMELRGISNQAREDYLAVSEPMEEAAREMFRTRLEAGVRQINFRLEQQGHEGPPFVLLRPKAGNDRRILDRILGAWLIRELRILGALEGRGDWVDYDQFTDFDYDTRGPAGCDPSGGTEASNAGCAGTMTGPGGQRLCIVNMEVIYDPEDGHVADAIWTLAHKDMTPVAAGPEIAVVATLTRADGSPVGRGVHTYHGSYIEEGGRLVFHWDLSPDYRAQVKPVGTEGDGAVLVIEPVGAR